MRLAKSKQKGSRKLVDVPKNPNAEPSSRTEDIESTFDGMEPVFGFFSQTKVAVSGIRLTIGEKPYQNVGDLASQLESIRRERKPGKLKLNDWREIDL